MSAWPRRSAGFQYKRSEMSILVYKIIHFAGVFLLMISLGAVIAYVGSGGEKKDFAWRKTVAISHGVGLLLALLGGFGMLARLGIHWPWPGWVWGKFIIWLILGAMIALAYRRILSGAMQWWTVVILGIIAAYLGGMKPF